MSVRLIGVLAASSLCLFAGAANAAVVIGGVQHPVTLTVDDLRRLPPVTVSVSFQSDRGTESASYTGALLWTIVDNAGTIDADGKNTKLRHTIMVIGSDGYQVELSEGEIDPKFEGKSVILAYTRDGKPLGSGGEIRLVVPGDHHGGRAVRDVTSVTVQ
jgi:DMSO/TMAO reductase YedYZ molybdopterin-dependent catalytic subunit